MQTKITYIVEYREPPGHDWMRLASDVEETQYKVTKFTRKKDYYYRWVVSCVYSKRHKSFFPSVIAFLVYLLYVACRIRAANEYGISEPSMPAMLRRKEGE